MLSINTMKQNSPLGILKNILKKSSTFPRRNVSFETRYGEFSTVTSQSQRLFHNCRLKNSAGPSRRFSEGFGLSRGSIDVSEEVEQGIAEGKPIVALESTIITHGMPFPKNMETAQAVEKIIREEGAIPATIAVLEGRVTAGLTASSLARLSEAAGMGETPMKVSRRDLARAVAMGADGGTTVAGTMIVAAAVGVEVFATGGIGGVHRAGQDTLDVSADLTELGRTPVCVISSGVKSILDIGRTLEFLETQGVCVATYGDSTEFPAFYTRGSGFHAPCCVRGPLEAARLVRASLELGLSSGLLIAAPLPQEFALEEDAIESAIQKALKLADEEGVRGKDITPYLLAAVSKITSGKSLAANMALIKNNARVGAQIAVELSRLKKDLPPKYGSRGQVPAGKLTGLDSVVNITEACTRRQEKGRSTFSAVSPAVIGGSNIDYTIKVLEDDIKVGIDPVLAH